MSRSCREPSEVGLACQSFADDALVAHAAGCVRRMSPPEKVAGNPILSPSGEAGETFRLGQVLWDPQRRKFLLYYLVESAGAPVVLRYATGDDGIHWDYPVLRLCEEQGSRDNNVLADAHGEPICPKCAIFLNPRADDEQERFVGIFQRWHYYRGSSPDGIRWTVDMARPVWERGSGDGLGETMSFMYDPARSTWRAYVRIWVENATRRVIGHGESADMRSWSGPRRIFEADDRWGFGAQVYALAAWYDAGTYWGLANMYFTDLHPDPRRHQTMLPYLLRSDDGLSWEPVDANRPFIPLGEAGQWDAAMIGGRAPLVHGGRLLYYYAGYREPHACARLPDAQAQRGGMGLAIGRRGGLVGLRSLRGAEAVLITRPFRLDGDQITVNAVTERAGWVKAELVEPGGSIVPTLEIEKDCDPLTGDATDGLMSWRGSTTAPRRVTGEHVRLRLRWQHAEVFGFGILQSDQDVARLAGGPRPVRCRMTSRPPVIDGRLDDEVWQDFSAIGVADQFTWFDRQEPAPVASTVYLTRDGAALYFGLHLEEPCTDELVAECRRIDGQRTLLTDDAIQIELQPGSADDPATLVLLNCRGVKGIIRSDPKRSQDFRPDDDPALKVATAVSGGCWEAEVAVPFRLLNVGPPAAGHAWHFNVHRFRRAGQAGRAIYSWSCTYGEILRHDKRGELRFG